MGGKDLKSRLYFLGDPKKLQNNDVSRHVCKGCNRVFHKSQGLEWHVMDEHPHLFEEVKRDLEVIAANKRITPERKAANMGEKRRKFGVDAINDEVKHDDENNTYSEADISQLLESSEEEDIVNEKNDTQECKDRLQKQLVIKKECTVNISKLILKERKCDVKLQNLKLTGANEYLKIVESNENFTNDDESIIIENSSDPIVFEQATSSHQFFNQPFTCSPQERGCYVKLQKPCLSGANDDCKNVVNDENYTGADESVVVETASDSSVIELSPSSNQLADQPNTSAAQDIDSVAQSRDLSSLAPVMVDKDKVQWWFK